MTTATDQNEGKTKDLYQISFAVFLFFLPFSQALTIPLFFSLKVSELAIVVYIVLKLAKYETIKLPVSRFFLLLYVFTIVVLISIAVNFFWKYSYPTDVQLVRLSPIGDSLLKFGYLLLAIVCLVISYKEIGRDKKIMRYFFWGTALACVYCWYLCLSGFLHIPELVLPGMEIPPQRIDLSIGSIIRCGTAKEGNFMALYLLVAGSLAFYYKEKRYGMFFMVTILTTFSTVGVVSATLYFLLVANFDKRISKLQLAMTIIIIAGTVTVAAIANSDFRSIVINKIIGTEETVENQNDIYSKLDRLNSAAVGLAIFKDNPFWGVGMSNYGLHYNHYNFLPEFDATGKRIPNNVYVELLSESGGIALTLFIVIWIAVYRSLNKGSVHLKACLIITPIYFFAFPSYTMQFIWMLMAIVLAEKVTVGRRSMDVKLVSGS